VFASDAGEFLGQSPFYNPGVLLDSKDPALRVQASLSLLFERPDSQFLDVRANSSIEQEFAMPSVRSVAGSNSFVPKCLGGGTGFLRVA